MKCYDLQWALNTLQQFHRSYPRVTLIHGKMIEICRARGIIITQGDITTALANAIRMPALGKHVWAEYKSFVKRPGFDLVELSRLTSFLRLTNTIVKEEMAQMELDFGETQLIHQQNP